MVDKDHSIGPYLRIRHVRGAAGDVGLSPHAQGTATSIPATTQQHIPKLHRFCSCMLVNRRKYCQPASVSDESHHAYSDVHMQRIQLFPQSIVTSSILIVRACENLAKGKVTVVYETSVSIVRRISACSCLLHQAIYCGYLALQSLWYLQAQLETARNHGSTKALASLQVFSLEIFLHATTRSIPHHNPTHRATRAPSELRDVDKITQVNVLPCSPIIDKTVLSEPDIRVFTASLVQPAFCSLSESTVRGKSTRCYLLKVCPRPRALLSEVVTPLSLQLQISTLMYMRSQLTHWASSHSVTSTWHPDRLRGSR